METEEGTNDEFKKQECAVCGWAKRAAAHRSGSQASRASRCITVLCRCRVASGIFVIVGDHLQVVGSS